MAIRKKSATTSNNGINYEVIEKCGILSTDSKGRQTELRLVSWNGREEKYDIRQWWEDEDGTEKCGKGITLTGEELEALGDVINTLRED